MARDDDRVILGLNPGIDSSAALVVGGRLVVAMEEERLSRKKMHLGFPRRAILDVLRRGGVSPADVEDVTFSFHEYLEAHPFITRLFLRDMGCPFDPENPLDLRQLVPLAMRAASLSDVTSFPLRKAHRRNVVENQRIYTSELRELGIDVPALVNVDHHRAHAASAYFTSGFASCLVVTADGSGDGASLTISSVTDGRFTELLRLPAELSAGVLYASVTAYLGFKAHRHEGKITGLAAFGDSQVHKADLLPCLKLTPGRHGFESALAVPSVVGRAQQFGRLLSGSYFRNPTMNAFLDHYAAVVNGGRREDLAAAVQTHLEELVTGLVAPLLASTGHRRLALAGGVFGNVKLNQRLFELEGVDDIFIHPNMGDGGNAAGSALHLAHERAAASGRSYEPQRLEHVYLGQGFADGEIEQALVAHGLAFSRSADADAIVGREIARGRIVGRFNGCMEYGPRALGNRSILAHPGDRKINDVLNQRLRRTEFMPFAPSVLEEEVHRYFDLDRGALHAAEFMTITCNVKKQQRQAIQAVTHVDGTARPHIVRRDVNRSYHDVLSSFRRETGLGVIVNTSFNIHEEPIICTPDDACRAFKRGAVDLLAVGPYLVQGPSAGG